MNAMRPAAVLLGVLLLTTACEDDDDPTQSTGPIIVVNQSALTFEGVIQGAQPAPQQIDITTAGGGTLGGLTLTTTYLGSRAGWLDAAISSTSTPTTLTVAPSIGDLTPGRYSAMLVLRANGAMNSPRGILVTFTVIGGHIFRFTPPPGVNVTSVSVPGEFNGWNPAANEMSKSGDTWTLPMDLDPGVYEYKYFINGNWAGNMCNDDTWGNADGWIDAGSDGCTPGGNAVIMISDQHLFRYRPPAAAPAITSVTVPGNFNGWDNTATAMELVGHTWIAEVDLAPNTYMYKFFINGAWPGNMCNDEILGHPEHDFWIDPQADSCDGDGNAVITVQ